MSKLTSLRPRVSTVDVRTCQGPAGTERIRGRELQRTNRRILERDEYTCQVCGQTSAHLEVDHITPLHLGGAESDENRQAICVPCHLKKSAEEERARG